MLFLQIIKNNVEYLILFCLDAVLFEIFKFQISKMHISILYNITIIKNLTKKLFIIDVTKSGTFRVLVSLSFF